MAGKVSLQRFVDCLFEGMGLTAATTAATAAAAAETDNGEDQHAARECASVTSKRRDSCVWGPGRFDAYSTDADSDSCGPVTERSGVAIVAKEEPTGLHKQTNSRTVWRCNSSQRLM
jgi:hypothetical protein